MTMTRRLKADGIITTTGLKDLIFLWALPYDDDELEQYFGSLTVGGVTRDDVWRVLDRFIAAIERELGTDEFRVVAGIEDRRPFRTVLFVGGVKPSQDFAGDLLQRWSDMGGRGGSVIDFDPALVKGYLDGAFPQGRFKYLVRLAPNRANSG